MPYHVEREFRLTREVFPSEVVIPEKLAWDVERIRDEHEAKIRATVLKILKPTPAAQSPAKSVLLLFNSVMDLGTELLVAALYRAVWIADYNPSELYDERADRLYRDTVEFVKRKYKSVASEIPEFGSQLRPDLMVLLRKKWLRIREEAKRYVHKRSQKMRDQDARLDQHVISGGLRRAEIARVARVEKPCKSEPARVANSDRVAERGPRASRLAAIRNAEPVDRVADGQRSAADNPAALGANSDRRGKTRKGDATLLHGKRSVSFATAEAYLGIGERQRQKLMKGGTLKYEGQGHNRKILVESLKEYLPLPEMPK